MVQGEYFFRRCSAPAKVVQRSSLITAPPGDSLRLISGGLSCSGFTPFAPWGAPAAEYRSGLFRSNPARSARSAFAGPRLRRGFIDFSASERLVHRSIQVGCVKTTPTSADCQPARRYTIPPWLRHRKRIVSVCGPNIIGNMGLQVASALLSGRRTNNVRQV